MMAAPGGAVNCHRGWAGGPHGCHRPIRSVYLRDPDRNLIEVSERA